MKNHFENPIEEAKPPDPWEEEELAKEAKKNPDLKLDKKTKEKLTKAFKEYHSKKN